ncbi:helix-turn-helix domain-containing protein [Streptomyces sp. YIM 98790]|uniref:helix-turn-helix domain-containing protein n=1 Tax=Streptomyces sp. YIM 98790 TaxID=2689077 RepID=UPI001A9D5B5B|nr:helix-turn-helix transcriptional regulator [Streptomyces sp. YIM 98790]
MTEEQRRRGPAATQVEATGQTVRQNVARLRKVRDMTTYQMAQRMAEVGRPIPQSGISRIESGARRVDVDDLMALAVVLNVSPSALLLPLDDNPAHAVAVTGAGDVPADVAWAWLSNERPLHLPEGDTRTAMWEYQLYSLPPGRRTPKGVYLEGERSPEELARQRRVHERLAAMGPAETSQQRLEEMKRFDPEAWREADDG